MEIIKMKLRFRIIFVLDVLLLLVIQVLQGAALNYFFIKQFEEYFTTYFLFVLDFFCLFVFAGTMIVSFNYFNHRINDSENKERKIKEVGKRFLKFDLGVLPFSYLSWLIYVSILIGKLSVIFGTTTTRIFNLDPQILQVCVALASIVFMLLVEGHNWHKKSSGGYSYITAVCKKTGIEIFDSVEMFDMLITENNISSSWERVTFGLASINFILPIISLYELSITNFGKDKSKSNLPLRIFHNVLRLSLIDIPFLIVRLHAWLSNKSMTMFMMKNLFNIIMSLRDLYLDLFLYFKPDKFDKLTKAEEIPLSQNNEI